MKRKKGLEKGIEALQKQVELHKKKKKRAEELGQEELVGYYTKEIERFEKRKEDREEKRDRKN